MRSRLDKRRIISMRAMVSIFVISLSLQIHVFGKFCSQPLLSPFVCFGLHITVIYFIIELVYHDRLTSNAGCILLKLQLIFMGGEYSISFFYLVPGRFHCQFYWVPNSVELLRASCLHHIKC